MKDRPANVILDGFSLPMDLPFEQIVPDAPVPVNHFLSRRSRIAFSEIVTALLKIVYVKGIYQTFVTLFEVIVSISFTPTTYMFEMFLLMRIC